MKFYFTFLIVLFSFPSFGKFYVNVGAAKVKKSSIAIAPFVLQNQNLNQIQAGKKMHNHLVNNLKVSGYFKILSSSSFIENPSQKSPIPFPKDLKGFRWENWKLTGADFLIFNHYSILNNKITLTVSFYNINLRKKVFVKNYKKKSNQLKELIAIISNDITKSLSGKKGIFQTKIASVRTTSGTKKELFLMNWNGSEKERLSFHRSVVLAPAWSPKGNKIAYTAFVFNKKLKRRIAALFLHDRKTKLIQIISSRKGSNLGADFFSNGKEMLITLTKGVGSMDIFKLNLKNSSLKALTTGPRRAINVEPSVHPKSNLIAFSSDRATFSSDRATFSSDRATFSSDRATFSSDRASRKIMIYTMDRNGKNVKQITFAGHYNSSPSWSPVSNELVFSGRSKGRFDIFKIRSDGSGLKRLTSLRKSNGRWANCESPSFSPDGRFIVFTSDLSGNYQLYIMNLETNLIERITFDRHNYKTPRWSPYL